MIRKYKVICIFMFIISMITLTLTFMAKSPIQATSKNNSKAIVASKVSIKKNGLTRDEEEPIVTDLQTRALDPVENEQGLKATPKIFYLDKNQAFPNLSNASERDKLVSNVAKPTQDRNINYEYVTSEGTPTKPSSEKSGYQKIYLKLTGDVTKSSIIVPIPVWVKEKNMKIGTTFAIQYTPNDKEIYKDLVLYSKDILGKSDAQLSTLIASRVKAYDLETGQEAKVTTLTHTIDSNTVGRFSATIEIVGKQGSKEIKETNSIDILVFGATLKAPYYKKLDLNSSVNKVVENEYFSKYQSTSTSANAGMIFEWAEDKTGKPTAPINTLDTSKPGFKMGYIKVTDRTESAISTVIPLPITIADGKYIKFVNDSFGYTVEEKKAFFLEKDFKDLDSEQIVSFLNKNIHIKAWDLIDGEENIETEIISSSIVSNQKGNGTAEIRFTGPNKVDKTNLTIVIFPDDTFENGDISGWTDIPKGASDGLLENMANGSKISFPYRGLVPSKPQESDLGFMLEDKVKHNYVEDYAEVTPIPAVDGQVIYSPRPSTDFTWEREYSFTENKNLIKSSKKYFFHKNKRLKQVVYDDINEILYVYDLSLTRHLNFLIELRMFNLSNKTKRFAMLEFVSFHYGTFSSINGLDKMRGFGYKTLQKKFEIILKDDKERWYSDYTKFNVKHNPSTPRNLFNSDFSVPGVEDDYSKAGKIIVSLSGSAYYQLGAPYKEIDPGQALKGEYQLFFGEPIPYMKIKVEPYEINVYHDQQEDLQTKYKLSNIPTNDTSGTIYATYPNGNEGQFSFVSNKQKESVGELTIPRDTLPKKETEKVGTSHTYYTKIVAASDEDGPGHGIPSDEYDVTINVYHIGGQPIPQIVKKGSSLTKKPEQLLRDQVILPGHKASYEFEGEPLDTSTEGVKFVFVKMTDIDDPEQSVVIKVPIVVVDGVIPTRGIIVGANNFRSLEREFGDISKEEINKRILEKSDAIAFDVQTGSTENITLDVESTNLVSNPAIGDYNASLKAVREKDSYTKKIGLQILPNVQNVIIDFKDEVGVLLHEPIVLKKDVGTMIDLTKEDEVQKALATIKEKHYALVTSPKDETEVPVEMDEKTVTYEFKGTVSIQSAPKFLNFGRKTLGTMFIKVDKATYDAPLFIFDNRKNSAPWTLTATLQKPLTSQEDPSKDLPRALRYKLNEEETVILKKDTAQMIAQKLGEYTVSDEWDSDKSGLQLEVPSGEVLQPGGYRATILWQVQSTP